MKEKVVFKKFSDGDVIAIFPEIPYNEYTEDTCMSYMHIGQHGECSLSLLHELETAKPEERQALMDELESLGYILNEMAL